MQNLLKQQMMTENQPTRAHNQVQAVLHTGPRQQRQQFSLPAAMRPPTCQLALKAVRHKGNTIFMHPRPIPMLC